MKMPERVVDAALDAWFASEGTPTNGMDAAITAALKEWIASGEARTATVPYSKENSHWIANTKYANHNALIIRMEPDND